EAGAGSTFTLEIPVNLPARPAAEETEARAPMVKAEASPAPLLQPTFADDRQQLTTGRKTLLVIEDEPAFARILYDLARELNYQCLVAHTAEEGFELAQQHIPHAVLLDMKLPDQSGMTVLARLKDEPRTRHVPVHVISVEDRCETALTMGAVGYLRKPVTRDQLCDMLGEIERRIAQRTKQVLVAESADQHGAATADLIGDDDVEVTTGTTGAEAMTLLKRKAFDCLILDLELADMNGDELLRQLSADERFSFPPVIVHASRNLTRDEEERLLRYSRSIIIKSARSPERLLDEVTLFLHKVEAELSTERRSMLRIARSLDRALEGRKILLVDDDVRNIFALSSV